MADDTAALVVELNARFDKFEKAMKDVARVVDQQTRVIEQRFEKLTSVISDQLGAIQGQLVGQIGLLGRALSALGPVGIAAALGVGALVTVLNATADAADRVGQKAVALKDFSQQTGFTIEEVQGLRKALNAIGVTGDEALAAISRFTIQLNELRQKGSGPLVEALQNIDSGLVRTMLQTNTTAEAFEVLIRALARMSTEQRNALARQTGGRGGIGAFAEMAEKPQKFFDDWKKGINDAKPAKDIEAIEEQFKKLQAVQKSVAAAWDAMYPTDEFMAAKIKQQEAYLAVLQQYNSGTWLSTLKELYKQSTIGRTITAGQTGGVEGIKTLLSGANELERLEDGLDAIRRKGELLTTTNKALADAMARLSKDGGTQAAATAAQTEVIDQETEARKKQLAAVNLQIIRLKDLKAIAGGGFGQADEARLQKLLVEQAELQKQKADPVFLKAREQAIRAITEAQIKQTIATREGLGVATEEQMLAAKKIEIDRAVTEGVITQTEAVRARMIAAKEATERYEAALVRASNMPGLTRLALDLANTQKQIDQFAVSSINTFTDAMADAVTGTKSLADSFKEMANSILKDLARIAIRQAIVKPLLGGLGGIIPGLMAGGPAAAGAPYIVGERGPELFIPNQSGMVVPNNKLGGLNIGPQTTNLTVQGGADNRTIATMQMMLAERDRRFVADVKAATVELQRRSML